MDDLRKSGNIAGTNNPRSKLDEDDVWDILEQYYLTWNVSINDIVEQYDYLDIKRGTISDIVQGRNWPTVYDEFYDHYFEKKGVEE
mgnify:FL=1